MKTCPHCGAEFLPGTFALGCDDCERARAVLRSAAEQVNFAAALAVQRFDLELPGLLQCTAPSPGLLDLHKRWRLARDATAAARAAWDARGALREKRLGLASTVRP